MLCNRDKVEHLCYPVEVGDIGLYDKLTGTKLDYDSDFKGVLNAHTRELIHPVTDRYSLLSFRDSFDMLDEALVDIGIDGYIDKLSTNKRGTKFRATVDFPSLTYTPADGKAISYQAIFQSSYDRSLSLGFTHGAMRIICTNGMIVSFGAVDPFFAKHYGNLQETYAAMLAALRSTLPNSSTILEQEVRKFERPLPMGRKEFVAGVGEDANLPKKYVKEITNRRGEEFGESYWSTYNDFTYCLSRVNSPARRLQLLGDTRDNFFNCEKAA